ncbi:MAG: type 1 glutamine amidotransferase [Bifidobacterium sp.]|jgi:GMP synthase-like glutamine amidotransferase|nr:type 1 glutamine amidotransferase [Bifidobacterium sp.]MCI1865303.1 type 1 glutamine amidotransferase [Bifidobacterium sp.]
MSETKALVIGHSPTASLRRFGPWLGESGVACTLVHGADGLPRSLDGYDALIVLGGAPMPDDDEHYPWLAQTRTLIAQGLERHTPMLGICLGGQLIAYARGGRVQHRVLPPEHGMTEITRDASAADDPLFSILPGTFPMAENHVDHITRLPQEAILLAHSDRTPIQGFRIGPCAWGIQFHPEVAYGNIATWDSEERNSVRADGFDWDELIGSARAHDDENTAVSHRFARRFADICAHGISKERLG